MLRAATVARGLAVNQPPHPTSPPYRDATPPPAYGAATTDEASEPPPFPLRIVVVPLVGAFAICIATLIIGGVLISWLSEPREGDGQAILALILLTFLTLGPASFAALFVWMMRRDGRDKPGLCGLVMACGLVPALVIGSLGIAFFTRNRGLHITGLVAVAFFVALALTWVLVAMNRQPLRVGMLGSAVGVIVLAFTVTAASLNANGHDRALERQAISNQNAPLALFDMRGATGERDGWRIVQVDSIRVNRSTQYGSLGLVLESGSGQQVSVDFKSVEEGGHCDLAVVCEPLLTLADGTIIHGDPGAVGTHFDFPAPLNQGWWTLYTSSSMSATELSDVVALLQPVTVDAWIAAQGRFDN